MSLTEISVKWIAIKLNLTASGSAKEKRENIKTAISALISLHQFAVPMESNTTMSASVFARAHAKNIVTEVVQRRNLVPDVQECLPQYAVKRESLMITSATWIVLRTSS